MLFRAVFWMGLVSILMPHEPGVSPVEPLRPSTAGEPRLSSSDVVAAPDSGCSSHIGYCARVSTPFDTLQNALLRNLARVKSDIEAQERDRA